MPGVLFHTHAAENPRELDAVRARPGVASVLGTIFFVLVFMLAMGALVYASGLQAQVSQADLAAEKVSNMRGAESLMLVDNGSSLEAINSGPSSVSINHVVLRFPNGTAYPLPATAVVPAGGILDVSGLVPAGVCSPGAATCASKLDQIEAGNPSGSAVGVVTSLGNSFWYVHSVSAQDGSALTAVATGSVTTSGTKNYVSTGLKVSLSSDTVYVFFVFDSVSPTVGTEQYNFEVHALPSGATLLSACSTFGFPTDAGSYVRCVGSAGKPIGYGFSFGTTPPVYESPGIFGAVEVGSTAGTLQIDIACTANCGSVTLDAGSFIVAQPAG
jgi:hypothetical protein